jgi:hypothetical protein
MAEEQRSRISAEERERLGQKGYKTQLAFRYLGVAAGSVERVPFLHASLKRIARIVNQDPLDLLASCDHPDARAVHNVYCRVPKSYKRFVPVEAVCTAAGVSPWRVFELIAGVAARQGVQGAAVIAAIWSPRLVMKTVEMGLRDNGVKDRLMMFRAAGFLR